MSFAFVTHAGDCIGLMQGWTTLVFVTTMVLIVTSFLGMVEKFDIRLPLRCLKTPYTGQTGMENRSNREISSMVVTTR